jgi:uncharacterized protein (TIGR03086 family)
MLVHHLMYEQCWVPSMMEGKTIADVGDRFDGDLLPGEPDEWAALLAAAADAAHAAVAEPGALERTVHLSFGDVDGREYTMELTADLAVHAWDLARAIGADDAIDADAVVLLLPWAQKMVGLFTGSGLFAPPIEVASDASDAVKLLALTGRRA